MTGSTSTVGAPHRTLITMQQRTNAFYIQSPGNADTLRCLESVDATDVLLPTDASSNPLGSKLPFNALFPVLVPSPLHIHVSLSLKEGV